MNLCPKCKKQLFDSTVMCPVCGTYVDNVATLLNSEPISPATTYKRVPHSESTEVTTISPKADINSASSQTSSLAKLAQAFMIVATAISGLAILPLAWCLPMTISYCKKIKRNQPVDVGFKVCVLLFVSLIGGLFMLLDDNN